ncbi:MAG: cysteine hydrolase [Pseudomonadota bacterium]
MPPRFSTVSCRGEREYVFSPTNTALLVIDLQKDFFADSENTHPNGMLAILPRVSLLIETMRTLGCKIIYTRETYRSDMSDVSAYRHSLDYVGKPGELGRFLIAGETGQSFVESIQPLPDETVIDKASFGAFYNTALNQILQEEGISHLVLCGVTTQCCVHSTLREAVDRGYWCLTIADCCAASEPGLHDAALSLIAGEGHLFGWVANLGDVEAST